MNAKKDEKPRGIYNESSVREKEEMNTFEKERKGRQREREGRKWRNQQRMIKEQNRTHKTHLTAKYYESSPIVFL
jgi:hypothetical protein